MKVSTLAQQIMKAQKEFKAIPEKYRYVILQGLKIFVQRELK